MKIKIIDFFFSKTRTIVFRLNRLHVKNRHALRLTSAGVIKHARSESDALSRRII